MMEKQEQIKTLPWFGIPKIWPYVKKYKKMICIAAVLGALGSLIDAVWPLFNRYALNHFIALKTTDSLPAFIAGYAVLLLVQVISFFMSTYLCGKIEMHVDRDLRNASFNHLQTLSFSYFNQNNVGYIHARVMSDTGKIGEMASWRFMDIVWNVSYLLFVIIVMMKTNFHLAFLVLLIVPVTVILITFFQKKMILYNRKVRELNSQITSDFNEGITGAKSIKTLVIENLMQQEFRKDTHTMKQYSVRTQRTGALFISMLTFMTFAALAVVLWKGGQLTMEGVMELGTLSVFVTYALNLIDPIQIIVETFSALFGIQVNIERFFNLMSEQSDVSDTEEVIEKYGTTFEPKKENWEELRGEIVFKDVSFQYPDGQEMVLEHFNLEVPAGTNVAIVGETGAGKSTLVNLVCRFFEPTKGQILIDGKDARERSQLCLHSNIGYVLQTPHLFSGSVRDNLRYGNPEASDEEIYQALKLVHAENVIEKMDGGLDSEVGEGGSLLSTGEKQLLSFARALLADPKILILDEATSSIDTVTEKYLQDAIQTVIHGRTSFVIAHRLSTIVDADVILVVKDGKIVEKGTHPVLMKQKGYYYSLYTKQFEKESVDMTL